MVESCQVTPSDQSADLSEMLCVQTRSVITWALLAAATYTSNHFGEVSPVSVSVRVSVCVSTTFITWLYEYYGSILAYEEY